MLDESFTDIVRRVGTASSQHGSALPATTPFPTIANLKIGTFVGFIACHLLAALAFLPWLFSWAGVVSFVAGLYFFGILGINIGYHRLLTHRSFRCPRWLERSLAILGTCGMQFSPAFWVAVHRCHH